MEITTRRIRKRKRDSLDLIIDVLSVTHELSRGAEFIPKTRVMGYANMSYARFNILIEVLNERGYIENDE